MEKLYEVIAYDNTNYKFAMGRETYVTPHLHREIELGLLLEGKLRLVSAGNSYGIRSGEYWFLNPCQSHELFSPDPEQPFVFLELQVSPSFFRQYWKKIDRVKMDTAVLTEKELGEECFRRMRALLLETAKIYFHREKYYELICAGNINHLFAELLDAVPYRLLTEEELRIYNSHAGRIQRITAYIEEHSGEKLLLSELAKGEGLTLNYLSHIFKDYFGMPFQAYLQRIRCQRAAVLLAETEETLSDISFDCGFSALKYMNRGFLTLFGCSPGEYRKHFRSGAGHRVQKKEYFSPHFTLQESAEYLDFCSK